MAVLALMVGLHAHAQDLSLQQQDGYYLITSGADLVQFAKAVNAGSTAINGRLTADIDMASSNADFVPIGSQEQPYTGSFDGQDFTISNLVINLPEQEFVGLFGAIATPCKVEHFILASSCSIAGKAYVGLVASTAKVKGDVYLNYLGNEGTVKAEGSNAGGIVGCDIESMATLHIDHCYTTGYICGTSQCACMAGWCGTGAQVSNCWAISPLDGYNGSTEYLTCPSYVGVSYNNCWSQDDGNPNIDRGSQVTAFNINEARTGELAWKMNGRSYINPTWYQTVGEDSHPTWKSSHGTVYLTTENTFLDVHDATSFQVFSDEILDAQLLYADQVVAEAKLKDEYTAALEQMKSITEMRAFAQAYSNLSDLQTKLAACADAYAAYQALVNKTKTSLAENPLSGEQADILVCYLTGEEEPCEEYPNGGYSYIISTLLLDVDAIQTETAFLSAMIDKAIASQISVDTDLTSLCQNADFAEGLSGWDYSSDGGSLSVGGSQPCVLTAYNNVFDVHQTLEGLPEGIYELQFNGAFRAGGNFTSTNYAAFAYMNDVATPIMAEIEGSDTQKLNNAGDCSAAFATGAYAHSILCYVTDGTLKVGIENRNTYLENDWTAVGGIKLYYRGNANQATEALDRALANLIARAQVQLSYEPAVDDTYAENPNYSIEYRTRLQEAVEKAGSASQDDAKLAMVEELSQILQEIYNCKIAYRNMVDVAEYYAGYAFEMKNNGQVTLEEIKEARVEELYDELWNAYRDGTYTMQQAQALEVLQGNRFYLAMNAVQDGSRMHPYLLSTPDDMRNMRGNMKAGQITYFRMENDIDMASVTSWTPLNCDWDQANGKTWQNFFNFDGQNHVISNFSCKSGDYASFFGVMCGTLRNTGFENVDVVSPSTGSGALGGYIGHSNYSDGNGKLLTTTIENVYVTGKVNVTNSYCGGLGGNVGGPLVIRNLYTNLQITSTASLVGGLFGRVREALTLDNVYAAGQVDGNHGIVGGGQKGDTPASIYRNVVVWNNTNSDFGVTADGDALQNISYFSGSNFDALQNTVVGWGSPWYCDMAKDSYPTFDWKQGGNAIIAVPQTLTPAQHQGIYDLMGRKMQQGAQLKSGLYIVNGKTVLIK